MSHYDETRNRFNPENRFIGDIENGLRYPFACYTKEESDAKYAPISISTDVTALTAVVATKAAQADLITLSGVVDTKASTNDLTALEGTVSNLTTTVSGKASQSDLTAYETSNDAEIVDIKARLTELEYTPIRITSYSANNTNFEKGSSVSVSLSWTLSKTATIQEINDVTVEGNSKTFSSVTQDQTYTLQVSDGNTIDIKDISINFINRVYYGAAANLSSITSLSKILSDEIDRTITVTATSGQYIIYAYPKRLGTAIFLVNGIEGGFDAPVEQTITNESGYSETYYIYKSNNAGLGTTTVEIREA